MLNVRFFFFFFYDTIEMTETYLGDGFLLLKKIC